MTIISTAESYEIVTEDKTTWGEGSWLTEPDRVEWKDELTGFPCLAHRQMHSGHWCGYVAVPPGHPVHGKDYELVNVEVHGGLTYGRECHGEICHKAKPGEPDDVWWLGFDCTHGVDIAPAYARRKRLCGWPTSGYASYKNLDYVKRECAELAKQLAEQT